MNRPHALSRQRGLVLVVVLIWMFAASLYLFSSVQNAVQEQKAARGFRDRAVALQAAEAGLADAEADISASPTLSLSRSALFGAGRSDGFPAADMALCQGGPTNRLQGLCRAAQPEELQTLLADEVAAVMIDGSVDAITVEYGRFTGRTLQTGGGMLPARLPRYVIELVRDFQVEQTLVLERESQQKYAIKNAANTTADPAKSNAYDTSNSTLSSTPKSASNSISNSTANSTNSSLYRITAIGFGPVSEVQVVLQSFYRKV